MPCRPGREHELVLLTLLRFITHPTLNRLLRFGFGRFTTVEEVDHTAEKCIQHVTRLREMSPLWEMVQVKNIELRIICETLQTSYFVSRVVIGKFRLSKINGSFSGWY